VTRQPYQPAAATNAVKVSHSRLGQLTEHFPSNRHGCPRVLARAGAGGCQKQERVLRVRGGGV